MIVFVNVHECLWVCVIPCECVNDWQRRLVSFDRVFVWCCWCVCSCIFILFWLSFVDDFCDLFPHHFARYVVYLFVYFTAPLFVSSFVCFWCEFVFEISFGVVFLFLELDYTLLWRYWSWPWCCFDFGVCILFLQGVVVGLTSCLDLVLVLIILAFLKSLVWPWSWNLLWCCFTFIFCVDFHSHFALVCIPFWHWFASTFGVGLTVALALDWPWFWHWF